MTDSYSPDKLPAFKAYDVRGRIPDELNEDMAYAIGRAYAAEIKPQKPIAVGHDVRLSSGQLAAAVIKGLNDGGVDTRSLGQCGTEMVYYAAAFPEMGGGVMVTASHNPKDYNGVKLVTEGARPLSGDTGLPGIERRVRKNDLPDSARKGTDRPLPIMEPYIQNILQFIDVGKLKPLTVVTNAGNGCAGPVMEQLSKHLPFRFVPFFYEPDGEFPNGVPNPLLPENRAVTAKAVVDNKADLGVAWDGDFDRCFLFDESATFIEGYYIVGLLAEQILARNPGAKIIHDPRLIWNTVDAVKKAGGVPVQCKSGHAFIKARMREENAVYGGEMSAHHYFRDFSFCDSGMIPWLLVAQAMCTSGKSLAELIGDRMKRFPCSGEINRNVKDQDAVIDRILHHYDALKPELDSTDGISLTFGQNWRFNLRKSNTEPVIRLNVETWGDEKLLEEKTAEILEMIDRP